MKLSNSEYQRAVKRFQFLDSLYEIMNKKNIELEMELPKVDDIAFEANLSKNVFYSYFNSRTELFMLYLRKFTFINQLKMVENSDLRGIKAIGQLYREMIDEFYKNKCFIANFFSYLVLNYTTAKKTIKKNRKYDYDAYAQEDISLGDKVYLSKNTKLCTHLEHYEISEIKVRAVSNLLRQFLEESVEEKEIKLKKEQFSRYSEMLTTLFYTITHSGVIYYLSKDEMIERFKLQFFGLLGHEVL